MRIDLVKPVITNYVRLSEQVVVDSADCIHTVTLGDPVHNTLELRNKFMCLYIDISNAAIIVSDYIYQLNCDLGVLEVNELLGSQTVEATLVLL
jgi:hypothetical protein